jgi:hypothetical protein
MIVKEARRPRTAKVAASDFAGPEAGPCVGNRSIGARDTAPFRVRVCGRLAPELRPMGHPQVARHARMAAPLMRRRGAC